MTWSSGRTDGRRRFSVSIRRDRSRSIESPLRTVHRPRLAGNTSGSSVPRRTDAAARPAECCRRRRWRATCAEGTIHRYRVAAGQPGRDAGARGADRSVRAWSAAGRRMPDHIDHALVYAPPTLNSRQRWRQRCRESSCGGSPRSTMFSDTSTAPVAGSSWPIRSPWHCAISGLAGTRSETKFVPIDYLYELARVHASPSFRGSLTPTEDRSRQIGRTCRVQYTTCSDRLRDDVDLPGSLARRDRVRPDPQSGRAPPRHWPRVVPCRTDTTRTCSTSGCRPVSHPSV